MTDRINREKEAARQELERFRNRKETSTREALDMWGQNMLRSVVNNQTAVLRSFGHSQAVNSSIGGDHVNAWTDFRRIQVTWPEAMIPNRLDRDAVLDTIAQMKGVMQHEMGHIRFTTTYKTVKDGAKAQTKHPSNLLFRCWNLLEDMKMESLVVESVPRIANYFGTMVANVVLSGGNLPMEQTWIMLAGRAYLPKAVLRKSYELFDQFCFDGGINDGAMEWFNLVQDYKAARTEQQVMNAIVAAYEFIQKVRATMPPSPDDMSQMENIENDSDLRKTARQPGSILDMFDESPKKPNKGDKGDGQPGGDTAPGDGEPDQGGQTDEYEGDEGEGSGSGSGDEDGEGKAKGGGQDKYDENGNPVKPPQRKQERASQDQTPSQSNHGDGSEAPTEELAEEFRKMADAYRGETRKDSEVVDMARKASTTQDHEGLPIYPHYGEEMSGDLQGRAMITALGIEQALNSFVTEASPTWHNRMPKGIIDPLAYRTKNVGDQDYRRFLDEQGNEGLDVHVSMLCDVSGSMGGPPIIALSEALFATAVACERLSIGATFTLWSSDGQNYRVWPDGNPSPTLWPSMGGTDPTKALDDLVNHNPEEAINHLVVVFTDGQWASNFPSLQRWGQPGRTFVLVRYGAYDGLMQKDMGADKHININDVMALPGELTKALIDVLAGTDGW